MQDLSVFHCVTDFTFNDGFTTVYQLSLYNQTPPLCHAVFHRRYSCHLMARPAKSESRVPAALNRNETRRDAVSLGKNCAARIFSDNIIISPQAENTRGQTVNCVLARQALSMFRRISNKWRSLIDAIPAYQFRLHAFVSPRYFITTTRFNFRFAHFFPAMPQSHAARATK